MSRYSFVLVDDEPEIREGIRDTIPWEDLGFSFAGACTNGFEALELAERIRPDVVMTDINMPFMDGLALTDRLLSVLPDTKVLIISGYDDFEYARKALRLQVYDYIVKPITPGEFKAVLVKLKETLDAEQENRRDLEHIKKQLAESIPILRERFLVHLVEGRPDRSSIPEGLAYFDLPLPPEGVAYQCLVLDFIRRRKGEDFHIDLITERNILEEFVSSLGPGLLFQDGADRLVILIWGKNRANVYREGLKTAELLWHKLQSMRLRNIAVGVGEAVETLESLVTSYNTAAEALAWGLLREKIGLTAYREVMGKTEPAGGEGGSPGWGREIVSALKIGAGEEAKRHIRAMTDYFKNNPLTIDEYHIKLRLVLAALLQGMEDMEIPQREIFPPPSDPFADIRRFKSLDEVRDWFFLLADTIGSYTSTRQENFALVKVREALDYLETHYDVPVLSLQGLCKKLDISTSYFSAIFKKHHDKTFVEELTNIRIRKAMELLRTTDLMTYEIAEKIGYRDAHYFSLSFRKSTGLTTTEYRNANTARISHGRP
ncbi:MAG: response regulator [Spirochaetaceae bacterium]|jgi:two-component system response regulator YesN|nr:response regulator [Spirochaetaceae bacterium]